MKISYIILVSFYLILFLFATTTYINHKQTGLINANNEALAESTQVVRQSNRFLRNFLYMTNGLRIDLLSNEAFFIQAYDSALQENSAMLRELISFVEVRSEQRTLLDDIKELQDYWNTEFAHPLIEAKKIASRSKHAQATFDSLYRAKFVNGNEQDVHHVMHKKFSEFTNYEYGFRKSRREAFEASIRNTERISIYLTVFSILVGSIIASIIAYYISSRLMKMVKMTHAIANGNYTAPIAEDGNSELSQLAKALNDMSKILDKNISLLKRQKEGLDQFAHIVSHDLKASLRGIDNVVSWIEEDHSFDLPPKVNEYLEIIKERIARAENLLSGVLMYVRIGQETTAKEHVHIRALLDEVLEYLPPRAGIAVMIQPDMPLLFTERLPLIQIFSNLIGNAIKHHDKENGVVKVYYRNHDDHYKFFVSDDGPGINVLYHEKIFQLFQTLKERDSFESTGVGLAIVKKILNDRKLPVDLYSEPGKGSTFSFLWPK